MTRIDPLEDDQLDQVASDVFDAARQSGGPVPPLYRYLAHSPQLLRAWAGFAGPLRDPTAVTTAMRELVILRVAHLTGSARQWRHHEQVALDAGIPAAKVEALTAESPDAVTGVVFDEAERAALRLVDEMIQEQRVVDETFAAVAAAFTPDQIVELALVVSYYRSLAGLLGVFDLR